MAKFRVRVTRDATESTDIDVEAETASEANDKALDIAKNGNVDWSMDEGNDYDPYLPDPESTERISDEQESG